ncbi:MAG: hypothetical protein K6G88_09385 [Lachnospiraceae bacterium]|nr:hypothetical protein [Lachnospiraceae bacterium]
MGRSKKTQFKDTRASVSGKDYFGTIYDGMCRSETYRKLHIGAKHFYTLCRVQSRSSHGKACLYKHAKEWGTNYNENYFVFPASHLEMYGIERSNAHKYFKELQEAGFIRKVECNKHIHKVNVYEFSDKWKKSD